MKESSGYDLHEENEFYEGTVVEIQDLPDGQYGPGLKWIINLDGEVDPISQEPRDTWAFCSQTLSPRSKLYKWAKGVLGETAMPAPGEMFDLARLVGVRVKVMFEHVPSMDDEGNPTTKEKVTVIKAGDTTTQVAPAPQVQAAPPPEPQATPQQANPDPF